jgi:hypothetical protein
MRRRSRESDCKIQHYTEVCTSKSDTLVTTLGPARQVCVFAHQENCQIGHSSKNPFLPGVSALSLLPVHTSVRSKIAIIVSIINRFMTFMTHALRDLSDIL